MSMNIDFNFDFGDLLKKCKNGLNKLELNFFTLERNNLFNGRLIVRNCSEIMNRVKKLIEESNIVLNTPESFHLDYLYIVCHLEAISSLLWAVGVDVDVLEVEGGGAKTDSGKS